MPQSHGKRAAGVLLILGAALCFAFMNLFVNLAGELPVMQKVFFRNLVSAGVVFVLLCCSKEKFRIHNKECLLWLFLRSFVGFLGVILNFYAIDTIGSISDASILNKLSPFFAILFSVFLLKEKPKAYELIFVALAFFGALFVVKPTFTAASLPALAGVLSGASAGFAYSCVRVLGAKGERGLMTVFFFSAFSTLVALPFFIAFYEPMTPFQWASLLLAGVSATGGQFFITARKGDRRLRLFAGALCGGFGIFLPARAPRRVELCRVFHHHRRGGRKAADGASPFQKRKAFRPARRPSGNR